MNDKCTTSSYDTDWNELLKKTRIVRERLIANDDENSEWTVNCDDYLYHFRSIRDKIQETLLIYTTTTTTTTCKQLQSVLRVAICCLSIPSNKCTELRRIVQQESYNSWHQVLFIILLNNKNHFDALSRLRTAQVLCNLITDCGDTALDLMNHVAPAPSDKEIERKLRSGLHLQQVSEIKLYDQCVQAIPTETTHFEMNWVDLILANVSHRPALAAVVACLHNSISSVSKTTNIHSETSCIDKIATSSLLISALLRHIVSAVAVQNSKKDPSSLNSTDEATEWIILTIAKLCRLGFLPQMYRSIKHGEDNNNIFPEHVVLLHSVRNTIEECRNDDVAVSDLCKARCYSLGGEGVENGGSIIDTHMFLTNLYLTTYEALLSQSENDNLHVSAFQIVLDILAESLSEDSIITTKIRHILGTETLLLQTIITEVASTLDTWYAINKAQYARNQTKMNEIEQCRLTTSVRVIGNLCFHCRLNQDLLRTLIVPYIQQTDESSTTIKAEKKNRNGLHVLLSTTSMSYACFTLREWAVVSIRSALDECPENQAVLYELEAQSSMQTEELEEMGIRVNLNVAEGTVSVDPLVNNIHSVDRHFGTT
jgi:hypothetical protein